MVNSKIPTGLGGLRLDQALAHLFPDFSRSKLQDWIRKNRVSVDGKNLRAKDRVFGGETVVLDDEPEVMMGCEAESIPVDVVYEDSALIIVNKPAGLVAHPAVGNRDGTLQNAILYWFPELASLPRAGIIHRIDKETSGLLVIPRTLTAHTHLVKQLQSRTMHREYFAITRGRMTAGGTVDAAIGRHAKDRKRFAVSENGRSAVTHYRVIERFSYHSAILVKLETGRTHQIRVHMAHIRFPLLGDPVYGGRMKIPPQCPLSLISKIKTFRRQALHAQVLGLIHPQTEKFCTWEVPPPDDMQRMILALRSAESVLK